MYLMRKFNEFINEFTFTVNIPCENKTPNITVYNFSSIPAKYFYLIQRLYLLDLKYILCLFTLY